MLEGASEQVHQPVKPPLILKQLRHSTPTQRVPRHPGRARLRSRVFPWFAKLAFILLHLRRLSALLRASLKAVLFQSRNLWGRWLNSRGARATGLRVP